MGSPPVVASHYRLLSLLGEGGMGRVYRAEHQPSGRIVALKRLHASLAAEPSFRRLLLEEATAAARLSHFNLVGLLEIGQDPEGTPFLVMEFVEGQSLQRAVYEWPGWEPLARALDGVLAGLTAAHAAGIIHRDLKPENVLVDLQGEGRILDFGVACLADPSADDAQVRIAGTPAYMPPEQLRGDPARPSTDLYAFGALLFELLTGSLPIEEQEDLDALRAAKERGPSGLQPREGLELPPALAQLVLRLLAPAPGARPRFARAVRDELASLAPLVRDGARRGPAPSRGPTPTLGGALRTRVQPEPSGPDTVLSSPALSHEAAPPERAAPELEALLPAGAFASHGASLLRLREPALVGRAQEREVLLREVRRVREQRRARTVLLVGRAGVGKSRLARWLLATLEEQGSMETVAAGFEAAGAAHDGLRQAILRLLGAPGFGAPPDPLWRWGWLRDAGATKEDLARLAGWLQEPDAAATPPAIAAELAHLALSLASRVRPVALCFEDLGWSRDGALELVELLVARPSPAVLVLATMREGTTQHPRLAARLEALAARLDVRTIPLAGLPREDLEALLRALVPLSAELPPRLALAAQGAPALAIELLHDWLSSGALAPGAEGFSLAPGVTLEALERERPVALLLSRRVRALLHTQGDAGTLARGVLLRAALLGESFRFDALQRACELASPAHASALGAVLATALLHGLLRVEDGRYLFESAALRDAVLAECDARALGDEGEHRRACLQAASALLGGGTASPSATMHAVTLFRRGGEGARARRLLVDVIREQAFLGDDDEAAAALGSLEQWLDEDEVPALHGDRAGALMASASWDYFAMRYESAHTSVRRAQALYAALGDAEGAQRARALEANVRFYQGRFREAHEQVRAMLEGPGAGALFDDAKMQLELRLADLAVTRDDLDSALEHVERAAAFARPSKTTWYPDLCALNLIELSLARGELEAARSLLEPLKARAAALEDYVLLVDLDATAARVAYAAGRAWEVAERVEGLLRSAERLGSHWRATALHLLHALCCATLCESPEAARAARAFLAAFARVPHDEAFTVWGMRRLAEELRAHGEPRCAEEVDAALADRRRAWAAGWS